jgi:GNAT superfamily N-acetyltransferase
VTHPDIRLGSISDVRGMSEVVQKHWEEVCRAKHLMVLDPWWEKYEAMEQNGILFTLLAGDVGYSVNFCMPHLHYRGLVCAQNDVLFVDPEHRGGLGKALIQDTEDEAARRGARAMFWHAKQATSLDALLPRIGYELFEHIYMRDL